MHPECEAQAFPDSTMNGRDDGEVQRIAAELALPRSGSKRRLVYDVIVAGGADGVINDEIVNATGMSYSHLGPRSRELRGAKIRGSDPPRYHPILVADSGRTRLGEAGAPQIVWIGVQFQ